MLSLFMPLLISLLFLAVLGVVTWTTVKVIRNNQVAQNSDRKPVKSSIAGWLTIVAIGLATVPLLMLFQLPKDYVPLFNDGTYNLLTNEDSRLYHPLWRFVIWLEIAINIILFFVFIYLNFLLYTKKALFPTLFICTACAIVLLIVLSAITFKILLPTAPLLNADIIRALLAATLCASIWVPYMLLSKRVKATFVR